MKAIKPVTGVLVERGGYYHTAINAYVNGRRKPISRTTGLPVKNNLRRAQKILEDRKREYDESGMSGMLTMEERQRTSSILLSEYMNQWLEHKKSSIAQATYRSYENIINGRTKRFFDPIGVTISTLTPQLVEDFLDYLADEGVNGSTQCRYFNVLNQVLKQAVRKDHIDRSPLDKVDHPKKNKFHPSFYTKEEALHLLEISRDDPCYIPMLLGVFYGMRRSEAVGLQWDSVDLENNQIRINHKAYEQSIGGKVVVTITDEMKTESSRRTLPLIPYVRDELLKHKARQEEYRKAFRKSYSKEWQNCVCVDPKGVILRPDYVTTHFKKFLEQNGMRVVRYHDLRHSCASLLVAHGVPMKQVQLWLGHSTFSTTADIYVHLSSAALDESAECLSDLLTLPTPQKEKEAVPV